MSMEKSLKYDSYYSYDLAKLFSQSEHRHAATTKVSEVISTRTSSRELSRFLDPSCNIPPWLAQVKKDQQRWPRLIKVVHKLQRLQSGSKWVGLNAMKEIYHAAISEIVPKIQRVLLLCSATQHQHSLEQGALILRSTLLLEISPLIFRGHLRRFSHFKSTVCVWNWLEKLDHATNAHQNNNTLTVYV